MGPIPAQTARYFYPRSPCGERLLTEINKMATGQISIHALLAESDPEKPLEIGENLIFLSTLSLRRATDSLTDDVSTGGISIHALLAESDLGNVVAELPTWKFLSTLSLRRATRG